MRSDTVKHISGWLQIRRAALLLFDMYVHLQLVLKSAYLRFTTSAAFDGCLCWCPVAPMCLDPMQHSHILDNSYLVIEFHNWCGDAPMHGAQQVQLLMGCLCWCPVAPMCLDPLQAAACIYIHAQTGLYIHIRVGFHCAQHDS